MMRDIVFVLVIVGIVTPNMMISSLLASDTPTITYAKDYDSALAESKTSGKTVLIVFKMEPCKWCEKFAKESLADPKVVELVNKKFVPVRLDRTHDLAKAYGVVIYPTTVIVGKGRTADGMLEGYRDAPTVLKFLEKK